MHRAPRLGSHSSIISLLLPTHCSQIPIGSNALAYEVRDVDWNLSGKERNWKYISDFCVSVPAPWMLAGRWLWLYLWFKERGRQTTKKKKKWLPLIRQLPEFTRCALRLGTKAKPCRDRRIGRITASSCIPICFRQTYAQDFSNGGNSRHAQRQRSLCLGNANSNKEGSLGTSSIRQPLNGNVLDCNLKCRQFISKWITL